MGAGGCVERLIISVGGEVQLEHGRLAQVFDTELDPVVFIAVKIAVDRKVRISFAAVLGPVSAGDDGVKFLICYVAVGADYAVRSV